jgi:transcriptional regulator with XRE-family HTH domain
MDTLMLLKVKGLIVVKGSLGARIRQLRDRRGWSQKYLSNLVGINNSVLSRIESNKRPVESEELKRFADVFEVSTDYLSGYSKSTLPQDDTREYVDIIDLSEEQAIKQIKDLFSYKGRDITEDQAKTIYYLSLGVVKKD